MGQQGLKGKKTKERKLKSLLGSIRTCGCFQDKTKQDQQRSLVSENKTVQTAQHAKDVVFVYLKDHMSNGKFDMKSFHSPAEIPSFQPQVICTDYQIVHPDTSLSIFPVDAENKSPMDFNKCDRTRTCFIRSCGF